MVKKVNKSFDTVRSVKKKGDEVAPKGHPYAGMVQCDNCGKWTLRGVCDRCSEVICQDCIDIHVCDSDYR